MEDKLTRKGNIVLKQKPYSDTKFVGHLEKSFEPLMRNENGILQVFEDNIHGVSKEAKQHQHLKSILTSSDMNFGMRVILDLYRDLVAMSKRAQSDLYPFYLLPKKVREYRNWLTSVIVQIDNDLLPKNKGQSYQHVIPNSLLDAFPLCKEISFDDDVMTITNDLNKWIRRGRGSNEAEWNKVGDKFVTNRCVYAQIHVESTLRPCAICGRNAGAYGDMVECSECKKCFHYGKKTGNAADPGACQVRNNTLVYWKVCALQFLD